MNAMDYLDRAVKLARKGEGHTRPNPPVGAVVVKDGLIIGEGYHKKAGTNHAETAAIADAKKRGATTEGASIYVTLEPCSKPGRVGACTDALIAAGIRSVYYAVPDPNPVNRDRAKRVLARQGIACQCIPHKASRELIAPFAKHITTGLPYVTVKLAMSLDGKICDDQGDAKWISSAKSRQRTGQARACVDAIMVGAETVRKDNPSLLCHVKRNNDLIRVVVSRSGKLPKDAQIFTDGKNPTLVFNDAREALVALGKQGCLHVLCEGGLGLARSLADQGLVDSWRLITAPIVIGSKSMAEVTRFKLESESISDPFSGDREGLYVL